MLMPKISRGAYDLPIWGIQHIPSLYPTCPIKYPFSLRFSEPLGAQTNIKLRRELSFDMPATLRGYILDKTTKAKLAWVMIEVNGISTTSNEEGYYELKDIPVGTYTLKVRTMLYRPYTRGIEFPEERVYELDIELERAYLQAIFL